MRGDDMRPSSRPGFLDYSEFVRPIDMYFGAKPPAELTRTDRPSI